MRGILSLIVILPLSGCLVGASQGRSSMTEVRSDAPGIQRRTVTMEHSGSSFGASVPIMMTGGMMGYGYGYGNAVTVTGPSCVLHPDSCAVIHTATVVQPMTVVSNGTRGTAGGSDASVDVSDLEARIERLESSIPKLKGATKLALRRSCTIITGTPDLIKDRAERDKIVAACTKILNVNPGTATKAVVVNPFKLCRDIIADPTIIADAKKRAIGVDVCRIMTGEITDLAEAKRILRKGCKAVLGDPEFSGLVDDDFRTKCAKLDTTGEEN